MFYSHEILSSQKHGVSTIWLVATIGNKSSTKRVTKKAIQAVEVDKACDTILEPGAPIALRLQGNLLYGVSRVYNQQCEYMLSDVQKIHMNMKFFFKKMEHHELNLDTVRARPDQLIIMDDPEFLPNSVLPKFDLNSQLPLLNNSQLTTKTTSQMSPADSSQGSFGSGPGGFPIQLDYSQSQTPEPRVGEGLGLQGLSSAHKSYIMPGDEKMIALPGLDDDLGLMGQDEVFGDLIIDEFGNVTTREEPELPPMFHPTGDEAVTGPTVSHTPFEEHVRHDQDDFIIFNEEALPDAPALPQRHRQQEQATEESTSVSAEKARARRRRKLKTLHAEGITQIAKGDLRAWQDGYLQNCGVKLAKPVTVNQARKNAIYLTFGFGFGNIGQGLGVPAMVHPLARDYSGDSLYTTLTGFDVPRTRSKKRFSDFGDDESVEDDRRVRPKLDKATGELNTHDNGMGPIFDDDDERGRQHSPFEVGRDAQIAMPDHPSSGMRMPWGRGSSAQPGGSSVKGHTAAQRQRHLASPSQNRGHLPDIQRLSDGPDAPGWSEIGGPGELMSFDGAFDLDHPQVSVLKGTQSQQNDSLRISLDTEGREFLDFIEATVEMGGQRLTEDDFEYNRKWIKFEDAFIPEQTERVVAARAFYNVLCLATKTQITLQTAGDVREPFGDIWMGVTSSVNAI